MRGDDPGHWRVRASSSAYVAGVDRTAVSRPAGLIAGALLAPWTALGSLLRRSRLFHPSGVVLFGRVTPVPGASSRHDAGTRLSGQVLVRFSSAWWKSRQWPDVLGCALRFTTAQEPSVEPRAGDQDLLLATVRIPATTLLAPLGTRVGDFLSNAYFGVSPFRLAPLGRIKLRLTPLHRARPAARREDRLRATLGEGPVRLRLDARAARPGSRYRPIAQIELLDQVDLDQEALRFDPFRAGRGLSPVGFVHSMRVATYAASRRARSAARGRRRTPQLPASRTATSW